MDGGKAFPRHCHPLPRFAGFCFAVSGRKSRKETIFLPAGKLASRKIDPPPAYTPPGTIGHEGAAAPSNFPGEWATAADAAEGIGPPDLPDFAAAQESMCIEIPLPMD